MKKLWLLVLGVAALRVDLLPALPQAPPSDREEVMAGVRGLDLVMDGDLDGAVRIFHQIQQQDPHSPLGYVLEADALWWKIYYATANLIDPDVFAVANPPATPYDAHFEDLVNIALRKSEERLCAQQDVARNTLYQGLAYALRARRAALQDKALPTARAGKKMRTLLLKALELEPNLTDAYLGLGIYNYFVDTLSALVKLLRFFIGLPGGSRRVGLQQLAVAAEKGELARGEAKFYLAKNLSRANERDDARSLELFRELAREYPHNPLWPMMIGSLQCRLGRTAEGEALYREVFKKTAGNSSEVHVALHRAARLALQRLHPEERFGE